MRTLLKNSRIIHTCIWLLCALFTHLASGTGKSSLLADAVRPRSLTTEDRQRYIGIVVYNFEDQAAVGIERMNNSFQQGANFVEICIHWDKIYASRNSAPNWSIIDAHIQRARELNLKIGIRILTAREFEVLWLRFGEDRTTEETAQITALTKIHVKVIVHRAKARLAKGETTP